MYVVAQALSYSGQPGYEWKHLQNVKFVDLFTDQLPLSEHKFDEMKGLNWISERRKKECLDLKENAAESSASLIHCLPAGKSYSSRYIDLSVFSDKTEYWCRLGELELPATVPKIITKDLVCKVLKVSDEYLSKNKDEDLPDGKSDADADADADAEESLLSSSPDESPVQST